MRNLKKILALVLAMMMVLSVMVFANAANIEDYTDADQVDAKYAESVDVLTGMGVFQGYDGGFQPKANVRRSEVAALVYRALTADTTDEQSNIWVNDDFDDLNTNASQWAAGYIGYASRYGYVVGNGRGQFMPEDYVTGYQLLVIMLRALGYGQNNEFVGAQWESSVATLAADRGITTGFTKPLSQQLTREEVAYLLFNAITVEKVTYRPALGYSADGNNSIGWDSFQLASDADQMDDFGRPATIWFQETDPAADPAVPTSIVYDATTDNLYATVEDTPLVTYYTEMIHCDVADGANDGRSFTATVYTNGTANASTATVSETNAVSVIGTQGTTTEIYDANGDGAADRIVYVDTYLAKVTAVIPAVVDTAGHEVTPASVEAQYGNPATTVTVEGSGYAVDDYILINIATVAAGTTGTNTTVYKAVGAAQTVDVTVSGVHRTDGTIDGVVAGTTTYLASNSYTSTTSLEFLTLATTMINQNYRLYLDAQGNLVGMEPQATTSGVGVITANQTVAAGTGTYAVQADLFLADGTTATGLQFVNNSVVTTGTTNPALFADENAANTARAAAAALGVGTLVHYEPVVINGTTYYQVMAYSGTTTGDADGSILTGVADTIDAANLLDDTTRFIVGNYAYDYSTLTTVFQGYSVYTGFKTIPTFTGTSANVLYQTVTVDNVDYYLLTSPTGTGSTAYVQSAQTQQTVDVSALFISKGTTYQYYSTYNVVINGQKTTINVSNSAETAIASGGYNRIYSLTGLNTSGYYTGISAAPVGVIASDTTAAATGTNPTHENGVVTTNMTTPAYLTVADGCQVFIVNPVSEEIYAASIDNLSTYADQVVNYEVNEYGYISFLYLTDKDHTTTVAP